MDQKALASAHIVLTVRKMITKSNTIEKMQTRVEYDLEYLRNWSLGLDLVIILRTVKSVWADAKAY